MINDMIKLKKCGIALTISQLFHKTYSFSLLFRGDFLFIY